MKELNVNVHVPSTLQRFGLRVAFLVVWTCRSLTRFRCDLKSQFHHSKVRQDVCGSTTQS